MAKLRKTKKVEKKNIGLSAAFDQINKIYGKGSIYLYGKGIGVKDIGFLRTSSIGLNNAMGIGGAPRGRISEFFGKEYSGKTTLALDITANAQIDGIKVAYIDVEHALDITYAKALGVNVDELIFSQPDYGEQALQIVDLLTETGEIGLIVVDSVAALVPKAELDGEMGDQNIGLQARLMSQAMKKLAGKIKKSNTAVIFINQTRSKINTFFGSTENTTGGNALKFYASLRAKLIFMGQVKQGEKSVANKTKVVVVKNKMAAPYQEANFLIRYGVGIDKYAELADLAIEYKLIKKSGKTYYYKGKKKTYKFIGKEKLYQGLKDKEKLFSLLRKKLTGE